MAASGKEGAFSLPIVGHNKMAPIVYYLVCTPTPQTRGLRHLLHIHPVLTLMSGQPYYRYKKTTIAGILQCLGSHIFLKSQKDL